MPPLTLSATDALLVIDTQVDFVSGSMATAGADGIIGPLNTLIQLVPHVIVVTDWHPADHVSFARTHGLEPGAVVDVEYGVQKVYSVHCQQGTPGADLDPRLDAVRAELILRKGCRPDVDSYSAFCENDRRTVTGLGSYLRERGIRRLFLGGIARYGCVSASALDGARDGFDVFVVDEATVGGPSERREQIDRDYAAAGIRWIRLADVEAAACRVG